MLKGGLETYLDTMQRRTLSTEHHFLEMLHRNPDETNDLLNQLGNAVASDCADAQNDVSDTPEPYGKAMLKTLHKRLRERVADPNDTVGRVGFDCLVGASGMLTNECKVWWSEKFNLSESA